MKNRLCVYFLTLSLKGEVQQYFIMIMTERTNERIRNRNPYHHQLTLKMPRYTQYDKKVVKIL